MSWSEQRLVRLKALWADNSASVVARILNSEFPREGFLTRSAVLGKVDRLGLTGKRTLPERNTRVRAAPSKPREKHRPRTVPLSTLGRPASAIEAQAAPELIECSIPIGQRRSLIELTEQTCHWPVGDPGTSDFFFCGGNTIAGRSYCAHHARVGSNGRRRSLDGVADL